MSYWLAALLLGRSVIEPWPFVVMTSEDYATAFRWGTIEGGPDERFMRHLPQRHALSGSFKKAAVQFTISGWL